MSNICNYNITPFNERQADICDEYIFDFQLATCIPAPDPQFGCFRVRSEQFAGICEIYQSCVVGVAKIWTTIMGTVSPFLWLDPYRLMTDHSKAPSESAHHDFELQVASLLAEKLLKTVLSYRRLGLNSSRRCSTHRALISIFLERNKNHISPIVSPFLTYQVQLAMGI